MAGVSAWSPGRHLSLCSYVPRAAPGSLSTSPARGLACTPVGGAEPAAGPLGSHVVAPAQGGCGSGAFAGRPEDCDKNPGARSGAPQFCVSHQFCSLPFAEGLNADYVKGENLEAVVCEEPQGEASRALASCRRAAGQRRLLIEFPARTGGCRSPGVTALSPGGADSSFMTRARDAGGGSGAFLHCGAPTPCRSCGEPGNEACAFLFGRLLAAQRGWPSTKSLSSALRSQGGEGCSHGGQKQQRGQSHGFVVGASVVA